MADITFGGLATGLPTEDLVTSLMEIERRPIDRLEADKEYETLRLQAYGQFNTRLDDLRSAASSLTSPVKSGRPVSGSALKRLLLRPQMAPIPGAMIFLLYSLPRYKKMYLPDSILIVKVFWKQVFFQLVIIKSKLTAPITRSRG